MKILFLIDNLGSGGAQRQMTTIAVLLHKSGIQVEFLCYNKSDFFLPVLEQCGIKVHWLIYSNPIIRMLKIRSYIRTHHFDVVLSFMDVPDFLNCFSAIGGRSWKVVTSERSAKEYKFLQIKHRLLSWFKRYSDFIVCNSENAKKMWIKYYPNYREKLRVIYNIVHLSNVTSNYVVRRDNKTRLLVAASYQYIKNPIRLVEAVNLLSDEEKSALQIDWYGKVSIPEKGISAYDKAKLLIGKYGLEKIIIMHHETSDIHQLMSDVDCIALFSEVEGLPNAICEGMFLGKPIIMSRVSDYKVLVDEDNGVLCEWNDVLSIKEALSTLLAFSDDELLSKGRVSKAKADMLFDAEGIVSKWKNILV